jgi:hypothetical protein
MILLGIKMFHWGTGINMVWATLTWNKKDYQLSRARKGKINGTALPLRRNWNPAWEIFSS